MAFFKLQCKGCFEVQNRWMPRREVPPPKCFKCGGEREYVVNVSTKVVEVIDNGAMVRPVEQLQDVEKLHRDRAEQYQGVKEEVTVKVKK